MHPYTYQISVTVTHPSLSLNELYQTLCQIPGVKPGRLRNIGEGRTTIIGKKLEGTYHQSWFGFTFEKEIQKSDTIRLPEAIAVYVDRLSTYKEIFNKFIVDGGNLSLSIGWYIDGNSGDHFSPELLQKLGGLGFDLDFDVYPPDGVTLNAKDQATKDSYDHQSSYEYNLSFRMNHPTQVLTETFMTLSGLPGFIPGILKKKGEHFKTPSGKTLSLIARNAYCTFDFSEDWTRSDKELSSLAARRIVDQLLPHKQMLLEHARGDGKASFWASWYVLSNARDIFSSKLLKEMAELKIELVMDMYSPDGESKSHSN